MSKYRICTRNSDDYPYGIEIRVDYFLGIHSWLPFTRYKTLDEARIAKNNFEESDRKEAEFVKRIIE